jgi:hypothetical protein
VKDNLSFRQPPDPDTFEKILKLEEIKAIQRFEAAVEGLQPVEISDWFERLLKSRIIPPLVRIGFEESFQWSLFKMAAPAWESMGPIPDDGVWFHPEIIKNIEEVRSGILGSEQDRSECLSIISQKDPAERMAMMEGCMMPENLFSMLENISTSWIILPRSHRHLEVHHAAYLLGYLKYLSDVSTSGFGRILVRIIIEFLANYTLKFITHNHPETEAMEAVFYGYSAMFWRNLRNPPEGFEHAGIFESFLGWAHRFANSDRHHSKEMKASILKMQAAKRRVFPPFNTFGFSDRICDDTGPLLITLRHGFPGIESAMKCFGIGNPIIPGMTDGRLTYETIPMALYGLFQKIKKNYELETSGTQESIRQFLSRLKAVYDRTRTRMSQLENKETFSEPLRFSGSRIHRMVEDLMGAIA